MSRFFYSEPTAIIFSIGSNALSDLPKPFEGSHAISVNPKGDLSNTIKEIFENCSKPNWDDEGSRPISTKAWINAEKLIAALPHTNLSSSAFATRNGKIGIQWTKTPKAALSLLIDESSRLTYAAIFSDGRRKHGDEFFDGTNVGDIREHLLQVSSEPDQAARRSRP